MSFYSSKLETAWVPVSVAADELGVRRQRIHQLLKDGKLVGKKLNNTVLVSLRSIEARIALLREENKRYVND